jgi:hypothetical protein
MGKALEALMNADPSPIAADEWLTFMIPRSTHQVIGGHPRRIGVHRRFQRLSPASLAQIISK